MRQSTTIPLLLAALAADTAVPPSWETAPAPAPTPTPTPTPEPAIARTLDAADVERLVDQRLAAQPQTAGWKDGFFVQSADRTSKLEIGGFTQFDGRFFVADAQAPGVDQFGFRSIRPDLQGTVLEHYDFRVLPDFAGA